jgi:hypothetical protein
MKKQYTKQEILESKQLLNEDGIESALMIAGFVPVIGEIADIILIARYIYKKEYLYAGLMLIALIPTVGDFIAKPIIRLLRGAGGAGKLALKNSDEMVKFAMANPQFKKQYLKIGEHLSNPMVSKTINQIEKVPAVGSKISSGMRTSLSEHLKALSKLKPARLGSAIGKEVAAGGKVSGAITRFFRDERLAQYVAKKGMKPSNWLSNWYNVVYKGYRDRRALVRNFIVTNKILDLFGLPSLEAFENKMENDENFRNEVANSKEMSDVIAQTTSAGDVEKIENDSSSAGSSIASGIGGMMGIGMLKMLAKNIT